jgi:hypothetical protein
LALRYAQKELKATAPDLEQRVQVYRAG